MTRGSFRGKDIGQRYKKDNEYDFLSVYSIFNYIFLNYTKDDTNHVTSLFSSTLVIYVPRGGFTLGQTWHVQSTVCS